MIAAMLRQPSAQNDKQAHTKNSKHKKRASERAIKASKEGDINHPSCLLRMNVMDEEKRILRQAGPGRPCRADGTSSQRARAGWLQPGCATMGIATLCVGTL